MKYSVTVNLKKAAVAVLCVGLYAAVFVFSPDMREGIAKGLTLCVSSVIPSLFLCTALSLFLASSGLFADVGRFANPVTRLIFGLSGEETGVFLLSLISGYPVGAAMISGLYRQKRITIEKARRMLLFCVNAGPAFLVLSVGSAVLGSEADGIRLLAAHAASSLITAVIVGRFPDKSEKHIQEHPVSESPPFVSDTFVTSVTGASAAMLSVCAFVVLFSGIGGLTSALPVPDSVKKVICSLLEVTVGVQELTRNELPKAAFLTGFAGISVIFQVASSAGSLRPYVPLLLLSRLWHGILSAAIICFWELLSPRSLETLSAEVGITGASYHGSPAASVALVALSLVLLCYCGEKTSLLPLRRKT